MRINPFLGLPIVCACHLPPASSSLCWRETGDIPAAIVVFVIAAVGAAIGTEAVFHAAHAAQAVDRALLIAALVLLVACALALIAALAEFTRVHTVTIASACAELAASYRHALTRLCEQLDKPVLLADATNVMHEWPMQTLDNWLQPPPDNNQPPRE